MNFGGTQKPTMRLRNQAGFSFAEVLMAMAVSGVLMVGIVGTYRVQTRIFHVQEQVASLQQNLRAVLYQMEREIRMTGLDPTGGSGAGIIVASPETIEFTEDFDGDGIIDSNERIEYTLKDTDGDGRPDQLKRSGKIFAEDISGLQFMYFDRDGVAATGLSDIASVRVTVVATSSNNLRSLSQTSLIYCRNLGLNSG
jgi:prepilin-type N-terminal cleavage/methylation domain-containing protein